MHGHPITSRARVTAALARQYGSGSGREHISVSMLFVASSAALPQPLGPGGGPRSPLLPQLPNGLPVRAQTLPEITPQMMNINLETSLLGSSSSYSRPSGFESNMTLDILIPSLGTGDAKVTGAEYDDFLYSSSPMAEYAKDNLTMASYESQWANGSFGNSSSGGFGAVHPVWSMLLVFPVLTVFGNVLVILAVYKERSLRSATNYFIVNLAIADLLVAAFVMPLAMVSTCCMDARHRENT